MGDFDTRLGQGAGVPGHNGPEPAIPIPLARPWNANGILSSITNVGKALFSSLPTYFFSNLWDANRADRLTQLSKVVNKTTPGVTEGNLDSTGNVAKKAEIEWQKNEVTQKYQVANIRISKRGDIQDADILGKLNDEKVGLQNELNKHVSDIAKLKDIQKRHQKGRSPGAEDVRLGYASKIEMEERVRHEQGESMEIVDHTNWFSDVDSSVHTELVDLQQKKDKCIDKMKCISVLRDDLRINALKCNIFGERGGG